MNRVLLLVQALSLDSSPAVVMCSFRWPALSAAVNQYAWHTNISPKSTFRSSSPKKQVHFEDEIRPYRSSYSRTVDAVAPASHFPKSKTALKLSSSTIRAWLVHLGRAFWVAFFAKGKLKKANQTANHSFLNLPLSLRARISLEESQCELGGGRHFKPQRLPNSRASKAFLLHRHSLAART